ncbi:MAG: CPBP family intramembrane metalloprotease [Novosphingobium sp.]|nr:CPBP family intramembrane metalloprotease [Novosphingobium sp.]MBO9603639.1 CPBP family intramembrane metalloprotease [Novosphingobium sp.]
MSEVEPLSVPAILRAFPAYLRHPRLIAPSGLRSRAAWKEWAILFALQFAVLIAIVLPAVAAWQNLFALSGPDAFDKLPPAMLVLLTVALAPVLEETFFRGWLTGRPRALWLLLCTVAAIGLLFASTYKLAPLAVGIGFLAIVLAAGIGWFLLRKKKAAPHWFARGFPAIFYLVTVGFALLHVTNYGHWSPVVLPLVLPQLWIGTVLAYIRMKIGLPGSILAHICSNASVLLLSPIFG